MTCCQNSLYNNTFDQKRAKEELDNFLSTGPKKNSIPLINFLKQLDLNNASVLDIGSGVGAVILELFEQGISHAAYNDFSTAYAEAFQSEAKKRQLEEQVEYFLGDFLGTHQKIEEADLVTLDKTICCYNNYFDLVTISVQKAKKWYAYTVPRDVWWVKLVHQFEQWIRWIKRNPFRSYVHPTDEIETILFEKGFKKIHNHFNREWQTVVFEKM